MLCWFPIVVCEESDVGKSCYIFFSSGRCGFEVDGCDVVLRLGLSGEVSGSHTVNFSCKFLVKDLIGDIGSGYEDCFSVLTRSHILWVSA